PIIDVQIKELIVWLFRQRGASSHRQYGLPSGHEFRLFPDLVYALQVRYKGVVVDLSLEKGVLGRARIDSPVDLPLAVVLLHLRFGFVSSLLLCLSPGI